MTNKAFWNFNEVAEALKLASLPFSDRISNISSRAQTILSHRSELEIEQLSGLMTDLMELFAELPEAKNQNMLTADQVHKSIIVADFGTLHPKLNPKPYELLAITATAYLFLLAISSELRHAFNTADRQRSDMKHIADGNWEFVETIAESIFEASDMIRMSEELSETTPKEINLDEYAKLKSTLKAKQAAKAKHAPINQLKRDFINWYKHEAPETSKRQAAEIFLKGLPLEQKSLLAPTNAARTLLDALRKSTSN